MSEDTERLAAGVRSGDPEAAEGIVRRYWDEVCRLAARMGASATEAEDVAQETFCKAFRAIDSYAPGTNLRAWLMKIAANCAVDWSRKRRPRPCARGLGYGEPERMRSAGRTPADAAEDAELFDAVQRSIQSLPEQERMVLVLRTYEGLPHREIARLLGEKEATVRWRLHEARSKLRRWLADYL